VANLMMATIEEAGGVSLFKLNAAFLLPVIRNGFTRH
jgi:hypothetical protein